MTASIEDHSLRYTLANELHARPFPAIAAPGTAVFLAIKQENHAVGRDRAADLGHLIDLLHRYGAPHPQTGATHFFTDLGKYQLKWEQHTEFVTYTLFGAGLSERAFDPAEFDMFPADWLAVMPGVRMTSGLIRIETRPEAGTITERLQKWFVPEVWRSAGCWMMPLCWRVTFASIPRAICGLRCSPLKNLARGGSAVWCSVSARLKPIKPCLCWGFRRHETCSPEWAKSIKT